MAGSKKISQLSELSLLADEDYIEIIDSSESSQDLKNKFTTLSTLRGFLNSTTETSDAFEDWDSGTTYDPNDGDQYVFYNGIIYFFIKESTSTNERPDLFPLVWDAKTATDFVHIQNTDQYLDFGGANQVAVADVFLKTGARAMTGDLNMGSNDITAVASLANTNALITLASGGDFAITSDNGVFAQSYIQGQTTGLTLGFNLGYLEFTSSGAFAMTGDEASTISSDVSLTVGKTGADTIVNGTDITLTALENLSISIADPGATLLEIDSNGGNLLLQSSAGGNVDIKALGGGVLNLTGDISFKDVTDDTKVLTHDVSGITTATTRTATWQDKDITVAGTADETFTGTTNAATFVATTVNGITIDYDSTNRNLNAGAGNTIADPSATNYKTAFGQVISDGSTRGVLVGSRLTTYSGLTSQILIGDNINIGQYMRSMVAIGNDIDASNGSLVSNAGEGVLIGNGVSSNNWKQTIIGWFAKCEGVADTSLGWCAHTKGTSGNHRIAIGRTATAISTNSTVFGSHTNNDYWFSNGETHKFVSINGTTENVAPSSRTVVLHVGADAYDAQDTPDDFNVAGGPGALAPGVPTGSGTRARLHFYQADGVDLGQNTKQALQSVGYVDTTGDLVWWDLLSVRKINSTTVAICANSVSAANTNTNCALKISNEQTIINVKSGLTIDFRVANNNRMQVGANSVDVVSVPLGLPSYTVAGVPVATTAGRLIYVSDESGGAVLAFSDGTNWRRVTDRAIIS